MEFGESTHYVVINSPQPVQVLQRWIAPYISRRPLLDNLLKPSPTPYFGTCDHHGFSIELRLGYRARAPRATGTFRPTPTGTTVYVSIQRSLFAFAVHPVSLFLLGSLAVALGAALISMGFADFLMIPIALFVVPVGVATFLVGHNRMLARRSVSDLRRMLAGQSPAVLVTPPTKATRASPNP